MSQNSSERSRLILGVSFWPTGATSSGWRADKSYNDGIFQPDLLADVARTAERGVFDYFFMGNSYSSLADHPGGVARRAFQLNGFVASSYLASITTNIGLVATINSSLLEPYHTAQLTNSLDHMSRGRFGLNLVTGAYNDPAYLNFSISGNPDTKEKYARATEFTEVMNALQTSWGTNWYLNDKEGGRLFDPAAAHTLNHKGDFFQVQGPLNAPPSPQSCVPLVHAGTSEESMEYGARFADIRFSPYVSKQWNIDYRNDQLRRAAAAGRTDGGPRIVIGAVIYPGATMAEARAMHNEVEAKVVDEFGPKLISQVFGINPELIAPHKRVLDVIGKTASTSGKLGVSDSMAIGATEIVLDLANAIDAYGSEDITFLDLFRFLVNKNHFPVIVGDKKKISDWMEEGFVDKAFDGVKFFPPYQREPFNIFVDHVVPELQRRGLARRQYDSSTLRGHLGL